MDERIYEALAGLMVSDPAVGPSDLWVENRPLERR